MKIEITGTRCIVTREETDPKYYGVRDAKGESNLLHAIKTQLNKEGYDLIKKRMWKDGHMVDDMKQYLRTRKKGAGKADIMIHNTMWNVAGADYYFNQGECVLEVITDCFNAT